MTYIVQYVVRFCITYDDDVLLAQFLYNPCCVRLTTPIRVCLESAFSLTTSMYVTFDTSLSADCFLMQFISDGVYDVTMTSLQ